MTGAFVADASIGIAWVVPSQTAAATDQLLLHVRGGLPFVVPDLWMLEVSNSLLVLRRRGRIGERHRTDALEALAALRPVLDSEGAPAAFTRLAGLADDTGLSVYDAVYLELAIRRLLPLATRDSALRDAARQWGVAVLP